MHESTAKCTAALRGALSHTHGGLYSNLHTASDLSFSILMNICMRHTQCEMATSVACIPYQYYSCACCKVLVCIRTIYIIALTKCIMAFEHKHMLQAMSCLCTSSSATKVPSHLQIQSACGRFGVKMYSWHVVHCVKYICTHTYSVVAC